VSEFSSPDFQESTERDGLVLGAVKYSFTITENGKEFVSAQPQPTPKEAGSAVQPASNPVQAAPVAA